MKSSELYLGNVKFEYFGKTVYLTFHDNSNGEAFGKFYKTESAAKAAATKFQKKLVKNYFEK